MMTIEITVLKLSISGKDLEYLSDACKLARVHIEQNKNNSHIAGFDQSRIFAIEGFTNRVFDSIPESLKFANDTQ